MIELLGVGVRGRHGSWCVRRVTARFEGGTLVAIVGQDRDEPDAILNALAGRVVPEEGRVWIEPAAATHRWLAWVPGVRRGRRARALAALNALGLGDRVATKAAALSRAEQMRLHCARAFSRPHAAVVVRAADSMLTPDDMAALLTTLRAAARQHRFTVLVSLSDVAPAAGVADRVLGIAAGAIEFDRSGSELHATSIDRRTTARAGAPTA